MSMPPPGGSIRMTSAPSAARQAPPNGAAMNAEISTIRRPDRIGPWSSATCRSQTEQVEGQLTCLDAPDELHFACNSSLGRNNGLLETCSVRHKDTIRIGDDNASLGDKNTPGQNRLAKLARLAFDGAAHADPSGKNWKLHPFQGDDVSHASVDNDARHSPRVRGVGEDLANAAH